MRDNWYAEIRIFPFDSLPEGWVPCDGQLLPADQKHAPLFSLIGTAFGGDGQKTFAVPDLRGRLPVGTDYDAARGSNHLSPSSGPGAKETQPTIALVYAISINGLYPSFQ